MSAQVPQVHVFCGPTIGASEVAAILPQAQVHPPVRHGDLLRLELDPGDTVVIVDGLFHQIAPVRHKEILHLLALGVTVVGSSSMGALRAAELYPFGMVGVGEIFAAYRDGLIEADDEVAVTYSLDGYRQLSDALADIRATVRRAVAEGILESSLADRLVEQARALPYASRGWPTLRRVSAGEPDLAGALATLAAWRSSASVPRSAKRRDAEEALRLVAAHHLEESRPRAWLASMWRTHHLREWIARARGAEVDGTSVPFLAMLRYQQIYDRDFAGRWRRFVMSWIAGPRSADPEADALAIMRAGGIAPQNLSSPQLAYWLTGDEIAELGESEKLARLVVRSVPRDRTAHISPISVPEAGELMTKPADTASAVAAALRWNDEVAKEGPHRTIYHVRVSQLRRHLAVQWSLDPDDDPGFDAAARDRGFAGLAEAVEAARPFFLAAVSYQVGSESRH